MYVDINKFKVYTTILVVTLTHVIPHSLLALTIFMVIFIKKMQSDTKFGVDI